MASVRSFFSPAAPDLSVLLQAIRATSLDDSLTRFVSEKEWTVLAAYLDMENLQRGHILTAKGALDRTVYFVESGVLRILYGNESDSQTVALVGAGGVVGEGAFFSHHERNATVQATVPCRVWSLAPGRFDQLRRDHLDVALSLTLGLGAVAATRMLGLTKRAIIV